jgi:hypothetical protein
MTIISVCQRGSLCHRQPVISIKWLNETSASRRMASWWKISIISEERNNDINEKFRRRERRRKSSKSIGGATVWLAHQP